MMSDMPHRSAQRRRLGRFATPAFALGVAVALAGASTAAANGWLSILRTDSTASISIGPADLVGLPDLADYGEFTVTRELDVHAVADAGTAAEETGLAAPVVPALPRGVDGEPEYQVVGSVAATFTFSTKRAAALPEPPAGLDGSTLHVAAGPAVAAVWSHPGGPPTLLVARAVAPVVSSSGVSFETARDYLLSLPGVPERLADQLRTLTADGSTVPIPVPDRLVDTTAAEIDGTPATVLTTPDRTLAATVWVQDGVVTVVAGALDADEVLAVARSLR
jgi:hypothetical protein